MLGRYNYWCPNGCGKTITHIITKKTIPLYKCLKCKEEYKDKKEFLL